jgi:hypothetical protein
MNWNLENFRGIFRCRGNAFKEIAFDRPARTSRLRNKGAIDTLAPWQPSLHRSATSLSTTGHRTMPLLPEHKSHEFLLMVRIATITIAIAVTALSIDIAGAAPVANLASSAQAPVAQAPPKVVSAPMPAGFPSDIPMPPSFTIHSLVQSTKAQWHSGEGLDAVVASIDSGMQAAGWKGHVVKRPPPAPSLGEFAKPGRAVHVQLVGDAKGAGTRVAIEALMRLKPGDALAMDGAMPADVFRPASAKAQGPQVQSTSVAFRADEPPATMIAGFRQSLRAAGWQLQKDGDAAGMHVLSFRKGDSRATLVTVRPTPTGAGSELELDAVKKEVGN